MPITPPIRLFIVFALLALLGFAFAAWTAGAVLPVLVGVAGTFAAAVAFVTEIDATPGTTRRADRRSPFATR